MNKTLILFTSTFPYQSGEQFLETEIEYLSKNFKKVVIVPLKKSNIIREIPANVIIDDFIINSKSRYIYKLKSLFSNSFLKYLSFNFNEIRYTFKNAIYVNNYKKWIITFLQNNKIEDCLFYSYWFEAPTLALSIIKNKYPKLIFVTRAHRGDLYEDIYSLNKFPGREQVVSNINQIFPISEDGKKHLINKYNVLASIIKISRLGVKQNITLTNSSQDRKLRMVSCSNLTPVKRVNFIIEALSQLKLENIDVVWTHIGGGPLKTKLETQSKAELCNNIIYKFLGNLTNKEVLQYYKNNSVDVFINTSESEGIPVSIMEAQSFGIPVIATNVGGTQEIVNNENGRLLSKNPNISEIVNSIRDVVDNKDEWNSKRHKSFENWKNKYNAEQNYKEFTNDLLSLF